jgi:4a-hydroxytetrahydrobiopterin dehydratase
MGRDLLTTEELAAGVASLADGWEVEGGAIVRRFGFRGFAEAFAFMTAVAAKAEEMDHHPEWSNVYNRVNVRLSTHSAGGVTGLDLEMARFMDEHAGDL